MSGGWIKLEKSIVDDPRVLRLAKQLQRSCNADALPGVTLVLGALARLWIFADSHIREDDIIDISPDDLDELIGIPGFCRAMPEDWLRILDDNTIELPGFQEHNGVGAKKRALTQKRVAQHRSRRKRESVTRGNADALPDLDQDLDHISTYVRARVRESTDDGGRAAFKRIQATYPKGTGRVDWLMAEYHCVHLVDNGLAKWDELVAAVDRYAAYVAGGGISSPKYVINPARFFSVGDWKREWNLPDETRQRSDRPSLEERARAATEEWLRQFDDQPGPGGAGGGSVEPLHRDLRRPVDEGSRQPPAGDADGRIPAVAVGADAREPDARGAREGIQGADRAGRAIPAEPERVLRPLPAEAGRGAVSGAADRSAEAVGAARGEARGP